jgi:hypothetical protein
MKQQLMALAAVRFAMVDVEGQSVRVREIGTTDFAKYGEIINGKKAEKDQPAVAPDKQEATAFMISKCVVEVDSDTPLLTIEEARQIAASARVSMPIVSKVMELSGFKGEEEKHPDAS